MISGIVYDIEKCIYKKGIDIMKKEILLVGGISIFFLR